MQAKDDAERFELLIWASARGLLGDVSMSTIDEDPSAAATSRHPCSLPER
jgi:hypothetical protein